MSASSSSESMVGFGRSRMAATLASILDILGMGLLVWEGEWWVCSSYGGVFSPGLRGEDLVMVDGREGSRTN